MLTGKEKFDPVFKHIGEKFAAIKRHFFAAPYEMMLEAVADNDKNKAGKTLENLSYFIRNDQKEKVWIAFESMVQSY